MTKTKALTCTFVFLCSLCVLSSQSHATGNYYRWVDKNGTVHYGTRPPEGVEATKIKTYGKSAPVSSPSDSSAKQEEEEHSAEILAQKKEQCAAEKARLKALKTPRRRIQMEQADGSVKYLSPQEVAAEVSASEAFIKQACN